jgi:hypothetical protein
MLSRLLLTTSLVILATSLPIIDTNDDSPSSIITRDVCIIGGGSTGTYSAVNLHNKGKSVVVIEAQDRLGGHTNTYTDPSTNKTIDYGVQVFHNTSVVKKYFAGLDITLTEAVFRAPGQTSTYVDFQSGKVVVGYTPEDPTAALAAYAAQLAKYPYVETGFDLPNPVPADLLLPFGDFVKKHALHDMVGLLFLYGQGLGDVLSQLTLYVFKIFGQGILESLRKGFLTTLDQDNSELYVRALAVLRQDVLLQSHVLAVDRSATSSGGCVKVLVHTPQGLKLILAKKLILTIPPKLDNLVGFDLSSEETELFGQFENSAYYTGLITGTNIPDSVTVTNIGAATQYDLPILPAAYSISSTRVSGLHDVKFGSAYALPDEQVMADVIASVKRINAAGTFASTTMAEPTFAVFASHTPFELTVPKEAIEAGFYKRLYALQGMMETWYTGAAWHTHDSSLLWVFTDGVLERVLEGL